MPAHYTPVAQLCTPIKKRHLAPCYHPILVSGTTWTINGSGHVDGSDPDTTAFVSQPITGDVVLSTRLISQTVVDNYAESGLMVRASSDPSAPIYFVMRMAGSGMLAVGARASQRAGLSFLAWTDPQTLPVSSTPSLIPDLSAAHPQRHSCAARRDGGRLIHTRSATGKPGPAAAHARRHGRR